MQSHNLLQTKIPKTEDPRTWDVLRDKASWRAKRPTEQNVFGSNSLREKHLTGPNIRRDKNSTINVLWGQNVIMDKTCSTTEQNIHTFYTNISQYIVNSSTESDGKISVVIYLWKAKLTDIDIGTRKQHVLTTNKLLIYNRISEQFFPQFHCFQTKKHFNKIMRIRSIYIAIPLYNYWTVRAQPDSHTFYFDDIYCINPFKA